MAKAAILAAEKTFMASGREKVIGARRARPCHPTMAARAA